MKGLINKKILRNKKGQTTTEYILIILVVVFLANSMKTKLVGFVDQILGKATSKATQDMMQ